MPGAGAAAGRFYLRHTSWVDGMIQPRPQFYRALLSRR